MLPKRWVIIALTLGLAAPIAFWQTRWLREERRSVEALTRQVDATRRQTEAAQARVTTLRQQLDNERRHLDAANASVATLSRELADLDADTRWLTPPPALPAWNADSPYVWIEKDLLPKFPVQPFGRDGALDPEVARVLALEPDRVTVLNETLGRLVSQFRAEEAAHAKPTEEHLPGIAQRDGEKLTIVVEPIPETGLELRTQFEAAVREQLSSQRAELLLQTGRDWVQEQFGWVEPGAAPPEPRTFSVLRHPDGSYNISIKSGNGWTSVGGQIALLDFIPSHLRHLFAHLEAESHRP